MRLPFAICASNPVEQSTWYWNVRVPAMLVTSWTFLCMGLRTRSRYRASFLNLMGIKNLLRISLTKRTITLFPGFLSVPISLPMAPLLQELCLVWLGRFAWLTHIVTMLLARHVERYLLASNPITGLSCLQSCLRLRLHLVDIYTDTPYVVQGFRKLQVLGWDERHWARTDHYDLWCRFYEALKSDPLRFTIHWVPSHQKLPADASEQDHWRALHNDAADHFAKKANKLRDPDFLLLHQSLVQQYAQFAIQQSSLVKVHKVISNVSK